MLLSERLCLFAVAAYWVLSPLHTSLSEASTSVGTTRISQGTGGAVADQSKPSRRGPTCSSPGRHSLKLRSSAVLAIDTGQQQPLEGSPDKTSPSPLGALRGSHKGPMYGDVGNTNITATLSHHANCSGGLDGCVRSKPKGTGTRFRRGAQHIIPNVNSTNSPRLRRSEWQVMYDKLCLYTTMHGSCRTATRHHRPKNCSCTECSAGFGGLSAWIQKQLRLLNAKKLSENRCKLLRFVGISEYECDSERKAWDSRYYELLAFRCKHGHVKVPQNRLVNQKKGRVKVKKTVKIGTQKKVEKDISLGIWVMAQRRKRTFGELDSGQIRRLDEVGFVWNGWDDKWEAHFYTLLLYRQNFGDCNVPKTFREIGCWVPNQRRLVRRGSMPSDRKQKLLTLGLLERAAAKTWYGNGPEEHKGPGQGKVPVSGGASELGRGSDLSRGPDKSSCMDSGRHITHQHPELDHVPEAVQLRSAHCPANQAASATVVAPAAAAEQRFFSSEGLMWDTAYCQEDTASHILDLIAQGAFDDDILVRAVQEGLVKQGEQWEDLYRGAGLENRRSDDGNQ